MATIGRFGDKIREVKLRWFGHVGQEIDGAVEGDTGDGAFYGTIK